MRISDWSSDVFSSDLPYVLKPVNEGSSVGVAIVTDESNYGQPISRDAAGPRQTFDRLLAEPFIAGRELTVADRKSDVSGKSESIRDERRCSLKITNKHNYNRLANTPKKKTYPQ